MAQCTTSGPPDLGTGMMGACFVAAFHLSLLLCQIKAIATKAKSTVSSKNNQSGAGKNSGNMHQGFLAAPHDIHVHEREVTRTSKGVLTRGYSLLHCRECMKSCR